MTPTVQSRAAAGVTHITLDRPDHGNAFSAAMVDELQRAWEVALEDPATHTIVLRGNGKQFCTGFDLSGLGDETDSTLRQRFRRVEALLQAVWHAPVRTVVIASGRAWGAGADLFASCDVRAAFPDATFRFPGAGFGIVLGTRRLTEAIGWDAARALVTEGKPLDARGALACGLVTQVISAEAEEWLAKSTAIAPVDRETFAAIRVVIRAQLQKEDAQSLDRSAARPGLKARIEAYIERARAPRH